MGVRRNTIPSGIIVMWSGSTNNIPPGWLLCDGTNGTPDLRDRFIQGTIIDAEIGNTGGSNSIVLTEAQLAPHQHNGFTNQVPAHRHAGVTVANGAHSHQYIREQVLDDAIVNIADDENLLHARTGFVENTSVAGIHSHSFVTDFDGAHSHDVTTFPVGSGAPIDITNPFYKLAFIMKD